MRQLGSRSRLRGCRGFAAAAAGACLVAAPMQVASAGRVPARVSAAASPRFTVTTIADAHDAHPGSGRCADSAGRCTLRAAVEAADALLAGSHAVIVVPAGQYQLTLGSLAVGAASAPVRITIDGAGPGRTVISAGGAFRVMSVPAAASVVLDGLAITDGRAGPNHYGGGVLSSGSLTVANVLVAHNHAGAGGGLDNSGGSLVVTGSRIEDNRARYYGGGGIQNGGPHNAPGSVLVVSSTITGNTSVSDDGGGIFSGQNGHPKLAGLAPAPPRPVCSARRCRRLPAVPGQTLTVVDSNVSGNRGVEGGGISAQGIADVTGSVIDGNSAGGADGGGIWGVRSITRSTISGNTADAGGGISSNPALPITITASTLDGNHALAYGGAINDGGVVTVIRSTLAHNTAGGQPEVGTGAAVEIEGSATLNVSDSTVARNTTEPAGGGAIDNYGGLAVLSFDTFSGNSGSVTGTFYTTATGTIFATGGAANNCEVPVHETAGFNLATDDSCDMDRPTDLTGVDPKLGPLAGNGGPTSTQALSRASPGVDSGGLPATSGCPRFDQRGKSRPWGPACDIGAFELHYRTGAAQ